MIEALQQAFQAGQNLVERDWHLEEHHMDDRCGCQPIGYADFQEWLEMDPPLNFVTADVQVQSLIDTHGRFVRDDRTGEIILPIEPEELVSAHPRLYRFEGKDLEDVMTQAAQTVLKNTLHSGSVSVFLPPNLFNFLTKCGFAARQVKHGYVFSFHPDPDQL